MFDIIRLEYITLSVCIWCTAVEPENYNACIKTISNEIIIHFFEF